MLKVVIYGIRGVDIMDNPFYKRKFVITGELERYSRSEALKLIKKLGGEASNKPVNTMDCLIMGRQIWSELNQGIASHKAQKAVELQREGKEVQIINEDDFYTMLNPLLPSLSDVVCEDDGKSRPPSYELGCCSLYYECSMAGHCVSDVDGDSGRCAYNRNLKAGKIFYSRNANDFSDPSYQKVLSVYKSLSENLRNSFHGILRYFFHDKSNSELMMTNATGELRELVSENFLAPYAGAVDFIIGRLLVKDLKSIYGEKSEQIDEARRAYNDGRPESERKSFKDVLSEYIRCEINGFSSDPLLERYTVIRLNPEYRRYFIEIAREYVLR